MRIIHYVNENGVDLYQEWVDGINDKRVRVAILRRIDRAAFGNFGDHKLCREGVFEMRVDIGPGYRVYYFLHKQNVIVLTCGGDKRTQQDDIRKAIACKSDFLSRLKEEVH